MFTPPFAGCGCLKFTQSSPDDFDYTSQAVGTRPSLQNPRGTYPFRRGLQSQSSTVQRDHNDERRGKHRGATIIARTVFLEHRPKLLILVALGGWHRGRRHGLPRRANPGSRGRLHRQPWPSPRATWSRNTGSSVSSMPNGRRPRPMPPCSPTPASILPTRCS